VGWDDARPETCRPLTMGAKGDIAIRGGRLENLGQMEICPQHLFNRGQ